MKSLNLTVIICILLSFYGKAQIALAKEDGSPITNGQIITFNTTNENPANLHYKIKNTSASPINIRIKIMDIVNANGSSFQFCYLTTCLPFISKNSVYPGNSKPPITIGGNSEVSNGYTMWNSDTGSGTFPIDYVVKYYLVDDLNNEYGTPVTFTYRYDPNSVLKANDIQKEKKSFVEVATTMVKNNIEVSATENTSYSLLNMGGHTLSTGNLKKGNAQIDVSKLNFGVYMITFKNNQGDTISKKIIKSN